MSGTTPRVGFYLPADDGSEPVNVATDINDNLEKMDNVIGFVPSTSSTPPSSPFDGMATYESDTSAAKFYKGSVWSQLLSAGATFLSDILLNKAKRLGIGITSPQAIVDIVIDNVFAVPMIKYKQTSENFHRLEINYDGFRIGGGFVAPETRIYRPSSGQIAIDAVGTAVTGGLTVAGTTALATTNISGPLNLGSAITSDVTINGNLSVVGKGWSNIYFKTVDSNRTNTTTATAESDFTFALLANTTYFIEFYMVYSGLAAADIKVAWTVPAGSSGLRWCLGETVAGTDNTNTAMRTGMHQFATEVQYGAQSAAAYNGASEMINIITGSTAGNMVMLWAQGTANATASTLRVGSLLKIRAVA
jgi:hypothetical protein